MKKLKNAPHFQAQNNSPFEGLIILVGSQAWNAWGQGTGEAWLFLCENILKESPTSKPIILGESQLSEIPALKLAKPEQRFITMYQFGELTEAQKTLICANLAEHTQAQTVALYDHVGQEIENLSNYIQRLREQQNNEVATLVVDKLKVELTAETIKKADINERTKYFLEWYKHQGEHNKLAYSAQQGRIYGFNGKSWDYIPDVHMHRIIRDFFNAYGTGYSLLKIKNVCECLSVELPFMGEPLPHLLAFNNGVLNKNTLELLPHSADYWLTGFNACDYAEIHHPTPHFDKWLNFISDNSERRKQGFLAGLYMILFNRNDWQLTLELIGAAGGGKSVYLEIGKLLAGDNNHEAINLTTLNNPRAIDKILNKTFLYSSDEGKYIGDSSVFKKLSSGEPLDFDPKNKQAFSASVKAIFAIASNTLPIYKNDGGGMERRRVIFPFTKSVPDNERDPQLVDKLKSELAGIVRKIIDTFPTPDKALQALIKQQYSEEVLKLKQENDHLLDFIQEFELSERADNKGLVFGGLINVPYGNTASMMNKLYWAYLLYCNHQGIDERSQLRPKHLERELHQAFKTAGENYTFQVQILGGNKKHTNATYKDKENTRQKWES